MQEYKTPYLDIIEFELEGNAMNSLSDGGEITTPTDFGLFDLFEEEL